MLFEKISSKKNIIILSENLIAFVSWLLEEGLKLLLPVLEPRGIVEI
jgi:hypothetical protein